MIYSRSGGYMGIGFAIPIAMARRIMEDLIYKGEVVRGWIGVSIQDAGPATRDALDLDERTGVLVSKVYDGHPADKAGIERGDVILAIAGTDVSSANELRNVVATLPPGEKAKVVVFRDGKEKKLTLTVARREPEKLARLGGAGEGDPRQEGGEKQTEQLTGTLGIRVANLTDQLRRRYGIPRDTRGVVVTRVDPDAFAPGQALREGDVIRQVKVKGRSFTKVTNVATLAKTARGLEPGDAVMLLVQRDGQTFYMAYTVK
jgi:serine protease Do